MKNYVYVILSSFSLFLFSCNSENYNDKDKKNDIFQNDSLASINRIVNNFRKSILNCRDSVNKYKIVAINDTCLKYIYVIYGNEKLRKHDSLTVSECGIKLTEFKKNADNEYTLYYYLSINDSIPMFAETSKGAMIHTFVYNNKEQKITKAYLGQHNSYMDGEELRKLYYSSLINNENEKYFTANYSKLHPDFVRLVLPNVR
ncbi:hypothetical protein [Ferruginibacter profundus]